MLQDISYTFDVSVIAFPKRSITSYDRCTLLQKEIDFF